MKILILLFLLTSCSYIKNKSNLNNKKILNFDKDYTFKEFNIILEKYNDRTDFPNIN